METVCEAKILWVLVLEQLSSTIGSEKLLSRKLVQVIGRHFVAVLF